MPCRVRSWCMNRRTVGFGSCATTSVTGRPSCTRKRAPTSHPPKCPVGITTPRPSARAAWSGAGSGTSRVSGRGRGPHCSMLSVTERANSANTRYASRRSTSHGRRPRTCRWLRSTVRRCWRAIAKTIAAIAGGEPRFHHSGPHTQPSSAKRRQPPLSKRSAARSRPTSIGAPAYPSPRAGASSGGARHPHRGIDDGHGAHRGGPPYRETHDEVRALAVSAADGDAAAQQLDELLGDAEAEPRAAVPRRRLRVDLLEVGGQRRHVRLPDADPAVPDEDEDAARAGRPPAVPCLVDEGKA